MKVSVLGLVTGVMLAMSLPAQAEVKSVVLVHGAFADGSGGNPSRTSSSITGFRFMSCKSPRRAFAADVAATRRSIEKAGPCVLVGHSYGGMIITEAGGHQNAKALVYVAAFQPDVGESAGGLQSKMPPASKAVGPVGDGFVAVDPNCSRMISRLMCQSRSPGSWRYRKCRSRLKFSTRRRPSATWKDKPSYAVVAKDDRMINPDLERFMSKRAKSKTIELPGSHAIFLSHPSEVAALIEMAAKDAK